MTNAPTKSDSRSELTGPGRLILVVGPSGAGKDTLIDLARAACAGDQSIVFPRRVVTREASAFENNQSVSPDIFSQMLSQGSFAFHWQAHGLSYALPRSVADDIRAGYAVVVNMSRTVIADARRLYANVIVVSVTAPAEILAARLEARSRSSDGHLQDRLQRLVLADADVTIENIGRAEEHAAQLLNIIKGI